METVPDTPSVTEYPIDNEMYVLIMPAFGVNAFRSAWSGGRSGWLLTGDETYSNIDKTLRIRFNPDIPVFPASTIVRTTVVEAQPKSDVGSQKDISWIPVGRATFSDPYNVYSGTIVTSGNRQFWGCDEVENTKDIGHELGHLTASSGRTLMSLWSYPISALWAMPDDTYRNEPVYGFGPKDSINSITTKSRVDGEAVSMLPPIRSSRAFRSGMAGELDRLSGARSGYILTEIDVAKPYSFIDSGIKLPVVSTYASGQFGIVVGTDKTQTISMMSYMTDNDPTYLTTGDAEVEQSIEIGAPRTPLSPTSPAQLDRYWNMIESQWETQHDPTIGSNESVRAAYIVTANTIMAWQGFTQLQDIYNVTVNQLSYMDDNHQLGIESQTLDASTNTVLNTIY